MDENRRKFCQVTGMTIAGAAVLPACSNMAHVGTQRCGMPASPIVVITDFKASDVALDDALIEQQTDHNLYIARDAGGLYAMNANCTHACCIVNWDSPDLPKKFSCSCHGSTFDANGQNPTAPAPGPLEHYKLTVDAQGNITVDTSEQVDPSTRTPG
jgi:Rieske Fe-S protein